MTGFSNSMRSTAVPPRPAARLVMGANRVRNPAAKPSLDRAEAGSYIVASNMEEWVLASDTVVRARIDGQVKEKAAKVLAEMGLSVSDAIRLLLVRVAT